MATAPSPLLTYMHGLQQPNPTYHYWVHVDQVVRSWIFAAVAKDLLREVRNLIHAFDIFEMIKTLF